DDISAVIAFSPSEYFEYEGQKIVDYAANIKCPLFVAAEASIEDQAKAIYEIAPSKNKLYCEINRHGSSALWVENDNREDYWQQIDAFLETIYTSDRY
ncbi:MAG: hypothetical protein FWG43_06720, partial [Clostridiales bacterium]|nr:hypothetical protein [Clostridiales bacterium]